MIDLLQVQREYNPIGTKLLIEVEIMEDAGHNKLTAAVCVKEVMEKVQELLGVQFNKIYLKTCTVNEEGHTLENIVESLNRKVEELKALGYNL